MSTQWQISVIIGLNLSAVFDTVQHDLLLNRLRNEFCVTSTALSWPIAFTENAEQYVKAGL